jgi:hypothetical protein
MYTDLMRYGNLDEKGDFRNELFADDKIQYARRMKEQSRFLKSLLKKK